MTDLPRRAWVLATSLLACALAAPAGAQAPTLLPGPSFSMVSAGQVDGSASLSDGSTVVIGNFTAVNGVARRGIARIRADGSVDADWGPKAYFSPVYMRPLLVADPLGSVYVQGELDKGGPGYRSGLFRLDPVTGRVDRQVSTSGLSALASDASGLYVVETGQVRKLSHANGETLWRAPVHAGVLALDGAGWLYAAVRDETIDTSSSVTLARFSITDGRRDSTWRPAVQYQSPLALDACGWLYATRSIGSGDIPSDYRVVRVSRTDGHVDEHWNPGEVAYVRGIAADANCDVFIAGEFTTVDGKIAAGVAKLDRNDGHLLSSWLPGGLAPSFGYLDNVRGIESVGPDRIRFWGRFGQVDGQSRLSLATVDAINGQPEPATDVEKPPYVNAMVGDPDGGVYLSGHFDVVDGLPRRGLLRMTADGRLDTRWAPKPLLDRPVEMLPAPGGDLYVAGVPLPGVTASSLLRLKRGDAAEDSTWNPAPDRVVSTLALAPNGDVYAAGAFRSIGGRSRPGLARLSRITAQADPSWEPANIAQGIWSLAAGARGELYAGGEFQLTGEGWPRNLIKLDPVTAALDTGWRSSTYDRMPSLLIAGGDAVYWKESPYGMMGKVSALTGERDERWGNHANTLDLRMGYGLDGSLHAIQHTATGPVLRKLSPVDGRADPAWEIALDDGYASLLAVDGLGTVYVADNSGTSPLIRAWSTRGSGRADRVHSERPLPELLRRRPAHPRDAR